MPPNYTEDHIRHHPLTRRAHLAEQMAAPRNAQKDKVEGPPVILPEQDSHGGEPPGAAPYGVGRTWPGSRPGASRGGVAAKAPDHLPYMQMAGTGLH